MKIFKLLAPLAILALLLTACPGPVDPIKSDAKNMTSFVFTSAANPNVLLADAIATYNDVTGKWVVGPVIGLDTSSLIASFVLSEKATASIGGVVQESGITPNSFAADVTYVITAEDGSTSSVIVSVDAPAAATEKDITAFSLVGTTFVGNIDGLNITVYKPAYSTQDFTNVNATFIVSSTAVVTIGGTTQVSGVTTNNFSTPVTYRVTAQDNSYKDYIVTVKTCPLVISEYYEGSSNNKYLEITNTGTAAIDLSTFGLRAYSNGATAPLANLFMLSGTLPAGKSVVYVNTDFNSSTVILDTVNGLSTTVGDPNGWMVEVAYVAGTASISFTGDDVIELVQGATAANAMTIDIFGVVGSSTSSTNTGGEAKFIRKSGAQGVSDWSIEDWYVVPVPTSTTADDNEAGAYTAVAAGSTLTEFWLGGIKGTVGATTVTVSNIPSAIKVLPAYFLTTAGSVMVGTTAQICGTTTNDYTTTVDFIVATDTATTTYTITATFLPPPDYVAINRLHGHANFSGGIATAITNVTTASAAGTAGNVYLLDASNTNVWADTTNEGADVTITGVVAAISADYILVRDQDNIVRIEQVGAFATPIFAVGDKISISNCRAGRIDSTVAGTAGSPNKKLGLMQITKFGAGGAVAPAVAVVAARPGVLLNYDFDGGLTSARAIMGAANNASAGTASNLDGSGAWVTGTNPGTSVTISGVVTVIMSGYIYIQDCNTAIMIYKSSIGSAPAFKVGDRITITNGTAGPCYYGAYEINKFGAGSDAVTWGTQTTGNTLYYDTISGSFQGDFSHRLVRYDGSVTCNTTTAFPYRGELDGDGTIAATDNLIRSKDATTAGWLTTTLASGKAFYAVLDVYRWSSDTLTRNGYTYLLITDSYQIVTP